MTCTFYENTEKFRTGCRISELAHYVDQKYVSSDLSREEELVGGPAVLTSNHFLFVCLLCFVYINFVDIKIEIAGSVLQQ